jgi:hypothetical protein
VPEHVRFRENLEFRYRYYARNWLLDHIDDNAFNRRSAWRLRDQELLDKQLRRLHLSPRSDGVMVFAFLAAFLTGMVLGGFLFAYNSNEPMQFASNDAMPAISLPNGVRPTTRH